MQTITLINQKGRGGKTAQKRLTKITNFECQFYLSLI